MKVSTNGVWFLTMLAVSGVLPARVAAATSPVEIRWNELATLVVGHQVSIPLAGGVVISGEALGVRDDSLLVDIAKTSNASRYPKGQTSLPRSVVTRVEVTERKSTGGRILGTTVGALAGMVAGGEIAAHQFRSEATVVSSFAATSISSTIAGYYIGRAMDRHTRMLVIAP